MMVRVDEPRTLETVSQCTCTGVGLRTKLAALTGRVEHAVDCVEGIDPDAKWYCGRGPCGLMDGHEGDCA